MPTFENRLSAALADRYRIERELGQGGMATVYLAEDLKHDRKVAVKVLKPELAAVLGAERFIVEIKTTAALQHPHILPLFDSGEADGFLYYVMPFIDGETLRAKLDRETQLGVDEALRITTEVAGALHYAHEHGVIHRDIKPENILLQDGRSMVADFGIALAVSAAAGGRMTETGLSLGTPHYMSPEQATAEKDITARSDQYSLASVLYEMLTGNPPHTGASAQQIIMKIITEQAADVTALRKSVPPFVADAVARALEKLPADRFASTREFAEALVHDSGATRAHGARAGRTGGGTAARGARRQRVVNTGFAVVALASLALAGWALSRRVDDTGTGSVRFAYRPMLARADAPYLAISNDGRRIAQVVRDSNGVGRIALRDLGSTEMVLVPGTEGATEPQFSPDDAWIAFLSQARLVRVPVDGGPATLLSDSTTSGGFTFLADGRFIGSRNQVGLQLFTESGTFVKRLTTVNEAAGEFSHWYPQALPGGRTVIFNNYATPLAKSRIEAVDVESGERTVLVDRAIFARYAESGHLLFARDGAVFAVPFDAKAVQVLGPAVPVLEDVAWNLTDGAAGFAVSRNGTLAYLRGSEWRVDARVQWADRSGARQPAIPDAGVWHEPRLSPDGRWIAATRAEPQAQLWLYDTTRRVLSQLTRGEGVSFSPVWMPDSRSLLMAREVPQYDIYRQGINETEASVVVATPWDKTPLSVSPDGRQVAYSEVDKGDKLFLAEVAGGAGTAVDPQPANQRTADISPDGRWLVYGETKSGVGNVFVRAIEGDGGRHQVSASGGDQPRFTKGGREIVFRRGDAMYAVPFEPASGEVGTPELLFRVADAGRLFDSRTTGYDVTPDGSRFLLVVPIERPEALPNVVVLNWFEELRRKVPR